MNTGKKKPQRARSPKEQLVRAILSSDTSEEESESSDEESESEDDDTSMTSAAMHGSSNGSAQAAQGKYTKAGARVQQVTAVL